MQYNEDFRAILQKKDKIQNINMFILKNDRPDVIKVFPSEVSTIVIGHYFSNLSTVVMENEFVSFIPDRIEKGTLQVLPVESINLWDKMLSSRNSLSQVDMSSITVTDYNCTGNTILTDIEFTDNSRIYFLTTYRNVAAWYSNNLRFTKKNTGKFHEEKGEILALTPFVDAVIADGRCYIINESNFNKIFKFDAVIKKQVEEHADEIKQLGFIDNGGDFYNYISKSSRSKNAMAKVIIQKRLEKIKKYSPTYIKEQLEGYPQLSHISYTTDDRIVIDKNSAKTVIGILCGTINLDLITKELNGIDENE